MRVRKSAAIRKAEITRAALELAFEFGPDRVTTTMIADRLSMTQPAIYKHFAKKEDIWRAAASEICCKINENVATASQKPEPDIRLRELVMGQLRLFQDYPALPELMVLRDPDGEKSELRSQVFDSIAVLRRAIHQAISEGQADGHFRSDIGSDDCTNLVAGVIQSLALRLLRFRKPGSLLEAGENLLDTQLLLIAERGARACDPV